MRITELSVTRRIGTSVIALALCVLRIYGVLRLPVNFLPDMTYPITGGARDVGRDLEPTAAVVTLGDMATVEDTHEEARVIRDCTGRAASSSAS